MNIFSSDDDLDLISLDDDDFRSKDDDLDLIDLDFAHPQSQDQRQDFQSQETNNEFENEGNFPFEGENDLDREIERNIAQQTSRIGETLLGAPGDIYSFVKSIFGGDSETNLPTSKSLREQSEKLSLGYTAPQNEFEERIGEVQQDIASFLIPGSKQYSTFRNIGIPVIANLVKEGIGYTGNEKLGDAAKVGTMIALDLMHLKGGGAKKFASDLFNESEKLVPKGATLSSPKFTKSLDNLEKVLTSGGTSPSKEKALKKISEIKERVKNKEIKSNLTTKLNEKIGEVNVHDMNGKEVAGLEYSRMPEGMYIENVFSNTIGGADKALETFLEKFNNENIFVTPMTEKGSKYFESAIGKKVNPRIIKGETIQETLAKPRIDYKLTNEDKKKILEYNKKKLKTRPEIEVKELIDFRKTINEIKSELGGYEVQLPKHIKKKAIANLDLVKKEVIKGLNEYGSSNNPEFLKLNKAANEAYAAYESSDKMGKFIKDTLKNSIKSPIAKTVLGLGGIYGTAKHATLAAKTAGASLPLYAGYESYKILHQVLQSPTLRKFYGNILKGAASGNASQVSRNAKSLEKELEKSEIE